MRGWCVVCSWYSKLIERCDPSSGVCWWCYDDGWRVAPERWR